MEIACVSLRNTFPSCLWGNSEALGAREGSVMDSDWYKQHSLWTSDPAYPTVLEVSAVNKSAERIFLTNPNRRITAQTFRFLEKDHAVCKKQLQAGY